MTPIKSLIGMMLVFFACLFSGCGSNGGGASAAGNDSESKPSISSENEGGGNSLIQIEESDGDTHVVEGGATDSYRISLAKQPAANVVVFVRTDGQTEIWTRRQAMISVGELDALGSSDVVKFVFTPDDWSVPRSVGVRAVDDAIEEGAHRSRISHQSSSKDLRFEDFKGVALLVDIRDNDYVPLQASAEFVTFSDRASENDTHVFCEIRLTLLSHVSLPYDVKVGYEVVSSSTALVGSDVQLSSPFFVFPAGSVSGSTSSIRISIADDDEMEHVEALDLRLILAVPGLSAGRWANFKLILHDNDDDSLLGIQSVSNSMVAFDAQTGKAWKRSGWGMSANRIAAATMDDETGKIYLGDNITNELMLYNKYSGTVNPIGYFGFYGINGLGYDPTRNVLYGISTYTLHEIDPATGNSMEIGTLNFNNIDAIAFNNETGSIFAVNEGYPDNVLVEINPATAVGLAVMELPQIQGVVDGIAFDPGYERLFIADAQYRKIYVVTLATGEVTLLYDAGAYSNWIRELVYDSEADRLISFSEGEAVSVDPESGEAIGTSLYHTMKLKGMAYSTKDKVFYAPSEEGYLAAIHPVTGIMESVGKMNLPPNTVLADMAYNPESDVLYAVNSYGSHVMYQVSPSTLEAVALGVVTELSVGGNLTYDPIGNLLYSVGSNRRLFSIDPQTLSCSVVTVLDSTVSSFSGLAFDPETSKMYGVGFYYTGVVEIDVVTGHCSPPVETTYAGSGRIAFNDDTATLGLIAPNATQLFRVDSTSLRLSSIGGVGLSNLVRLTYDSTNGVVYGGQNKNLISIDPLYGEVSDIGKVSDQQVTGLAYCSADETLYGFVATYYDNLVSIDSQTGGSTVITNYSPIQSVKGMAYRESNATMYLLNSSTSVYSIDLDSLALTSHGHLPVLSSYVGLTCNPLTDKLYSIKNGLGLCVVNMDTLSVTEIGASNSAFQITGLTWYESQR